MSKCISAISVDVKEEENNIKDDQQAYLSNQIPSDDIKNSFIYAFNGIIEDTTDECVIEYVDNIIGALKKAIYLSSIQRNDFYTDLIVLCLYIRNIRNHGKGFRKQSYAMYLKLLEYFPITMIDLLEEFKNNGSWLDLNKLMLLVTESRNTNMVNIYNQLLDKIHILYINQLKEDRYSLDTWNKKKNYMGKLQSLFIDKCKISLAAKWIPKQGKAIDRRTECAKIFAKMLNPDIFMTNKNRAMRLFREYYAPLQDAIHTTEKYECSKRFDKINFIFVPGKCMYKKKKAYLYEKKTGKDLRGNDSQRLTCRNNLLTYLESIKAKQVALDDKIMYTSDMIVDNKTDEEPLTSWEIFRKAVDAECFNNARTIIQCIGESPFIKYGVSMLEDIFEPRVDLTKTLTVEDYAYKHGLAKISTDSNLIDSKLLIQKNMEQYTNIDILSKSYSLYPPPVPPSSPSCLIDKAPYMRLKQLTELLQLGLITEDDHNKARKDILDML